ncbi:sialomucin core protein 24 isoform X3 [Chiloscyllium plagiosum]|uniref:sialomucin core protein 24 isoform X3 n=1 Tax=Chiloscyllium plagiosum TaxID=36176 RepID=UPI001CB7B829|nr:sialomucin core protein 24 isoform X3 [Chiloscyllium plagiosum]
MKWAEIAAGISLLALLSGVCGGQAAEIFCVAKTSENLTDCTTHDEVSMCEGSSHRMAPNVFTSSITDNETLSFLATPPIFNASNAVTTFISTAATTAKEASSTAESDITTEIPTTTPVYSPSSFDPASFIGGIVLVLGAEAAFFFAVKFFKARDGTYQTLI